MLDKSLDKNIELAKQCSVHAAMLIASDNKRKDKQKSIDDLVKEVLSLNPKCTDIGAGKMARLIELAEVVNG